MHLAYLFLCSTAALSLSLSLTPRRPRPCFPAGLSLRPFPHRRGRRDCGSGREPARPPLPPAVPGQVQRPQQPSAPSPRRRMLPGQHQVSWVLGSLEGPRVAGWTGCSRCGAACPRTRAGGEGSALQALRSHHVWQEAMRAFYTSVPADGSHVCKARAATSQGHARTRVCTLAGPAWALSHPGAWPSFCGWHYR